MVTPQGRPLHNGNASPASAPATLVALVLGTDERARVREAVRGRAGVRFAERMDEVISLLGNEAAPLIGLLIEPHDRDGRSAASLVQSIRRRMPTLPVIGYCRVGHEHSSAILGLAGAGVHELIFRGVDDSGVALRAALASAEQVCVADVLLCRLLPMLPASLHPFARYSLTFPRSAHTVGEVASALGVDRKTLANYCARAQLPAPAPLLAWCRLLLAAHYLVTTTRTVEKIALQLDFPSDTALRNAIKRYTGMRAQDLRAHGGTACIFARLEVLLTRNSCARSA